MSIASDSAIKLSQNAEFLIESNKACESYLLQAISEYPVDEVCLLPFLFAIFPLGFDCGIFSIHMKGLFLASFEKYLSSFTSEKSIFGAILCERLSGLLVALIGSDFIIQYCNKTYACGCHFYLFRLEAFAPSLCSFSQNTRGISSRLSTLRLSIPFEDFEGKIFS